MSARAEEYEIKIDGVSRTLRDVKVAAIEAARELARRNPGAQIAVTDLRDGSVVKWEM